MDSEKEIWVDYIKVVACILVVLGHFFQSMVKSNIIVNNCVFLWFDRTIYYFHVQLFFMCSGYLYQRYSKVDSFRSWKNNIIKKAINLGIPFFFFSTLTWTMKTMFSSLTNNSIGGIVEVLLKKPYPPYWYLYVLFFVFSVVPTVASSVGLSILLATSVILKVFVCLSGDLSIWNVYAIYGVCEYLIWFALGMCLAFFGAKVVKNRFLGVLLFLIFIGISVFIREVSNKIFQTGMTLLGCVAIFMIMVLSQRNRVLDLLTPYTMPIFLMHTLCATPIRIFLLRFGIDAVIIHFILGLIASFGGPIIAILVMKKIGFDFFIYPGKYIKIK